MATAKKSKFPDAADLRMDPDLTAAIEELLAPHSGKALEAAQGAVVKVRRSGITGSFGELVAAYDDAITAAVGEK